MKKKSRFIVMLTMLAACAGASSNVMNFKTGQVYTYRSYDDGSVVFQDSILESRLDSVRNGYWKTGYKVPIRPFLRKYEDRIDSSLAFFQEEQSNRDSWVPGATAAYTESLWLLSRRNGYWYSLELITGDTSQKSVSVQMFRFDDTSSTFRMAIEHSANKHFVRSGSLPYLATAMMDLGIVSVTYPLYELAPQAANPGVASAEFQPFFNKSQSAFYLASINLGADTLYQSSGALEQVAVVVAGAGSGALWDVYDLQGISHGVGLDASALKALPAGQYWALRRSAGRNLGQRIVVP